MRILLLSPPFRRDYMRNARCDFVSLSGTQWYPILLATAGAFLEKRGHEVLLVDAPAAGLSRLQVMERARGFRPELAVIYGGRLSEDNDIEIADGLVEANGCRAIFCGPYVSAVPDRWLKKSRRVWAAVCGEMEYPLLEFAEEKPLAEIAGLVYRRDDEIKTNPPRPYLTGDELESIPFVSEFLSRQVNPRLYRAISEPFPFMDMLTGRGCYWGVCSFCLWVHTYVRGPVYNARSLPNVLAEIDFIRRKLPWARSIMFQDDTLPPVRAEDLARGILKMGGRIKWSCYARGEYELETMRLMKRAGCLNLHVGFESAAEKVLKKAAKGISRERMTRFARDARAAGLRIHGDFLIGLEGENEDSIRETIRWALELDVDTAQFQVMIPFEGTPLHTSLAAQGMLKNGLPSYPGLSAEDLTRWSRFAYRKFYLRPGRLWRIIIHPRSRLLHYARVAHKILPAVFGQGRS